MVCGFSPVRALARRGFISEWAGRKRGLGAERPSWTAGARVGVGVEGAGWFMRPGGLARGSKTLQVRVRGSPLFDS